MKRWVSIFLGIVMMMLALAVPALAQVGTAEAAQGVAHCAYTVEFTYEGRQYVMDGDSSVRLSKCLDAVGLAGEVEAVEVSDPGLFSVSDKTGEWVVTAHRAFDTAEWMKVSINGVVYEIIVTDDQTPYNIADGDIKIDNSNVSAWDGRTITGTRTGDTSSFAITVDRHYGAIVIDGVNVNLTIKDLNIAASGEEVKKVSPILLVNEASLTLTLAELSIVWDSAAQSPR